MGPDRTFTLLRPATEDFYRRATCAESRCGDFLHGWATILDERTDDGAAGARYIRRESGRGFTEHRDESGLTVFTFAAGQRCFRSDDDDHQVRIEREPLFLVRSGGRTVRRHSRGADWVDDFSDSLDRVAGRIARG